MTHTSFTFTATFTNKPSYEDILEFSLSHEVSCFPTETEYSYDFFSDDLDRLEQIHDQLAPIAGPITTLID